MSQNTQEPAFSFGKHRGLTPTQVAAKDSGYLDWMLQQQDLCAKAPALADAARAALERQASAAPDASAVRLSPCEPVALECSIRGGGRMREGVSELHRLVPRDTPGVVDRVPVRQDDQRSRSGRSGEIQYQLPGAGPHVLDAVHTSGSIGRPTHERAYYLVEGHGTAGERWQKIEGGAEAAQAVARERVPQEASFRRQSAAERLGHEMSR